ncbi:hypothetical protein [Cellulomonas sp. ES6]|uniref:hypothetical protein n=1 Tax=Cellulomonas sp. ES6 TaxID=3039384 RepID=UPI0024B81E86|nr:hypothetical protein [Cellulomonas sp. ES6]WHP18815.1 hypothetical protein P9841_06780 [Cellulomonas sp. ES6]
MATDSNVVPMRQTASETPSQDWAPILASGSGPHVCTRCATEFTVRTWHVVWPANSHRPVCSACALDDPVLRTWALRSIAADAIDRALTETADSAQRRAVALALVSDVSWFANWRESETYIDVYVPPADDGDDPEDDAFAGLTLGDEPQSIRRAAFRAAKVLDRHITEDDHLLDAVEHAYGNGTDHELATAVLTIVAAAEAVGP